MNIVEGLRKVLQEILVPELRVIQDTLKEHSVILKEHSERFEAIDKRFEQVDTRFEKVFKQLSLIREDLKEINVKLDLSERISRLEGAQDEMRREFMERLFGKSMVASG
ncbi:MAG: hypothetical protein AB1595_00715 [bacterium]